MVDLELLLFKVISMASVEFGSAQNDDFVKKDAKLPVIRFGIGKAPKAARAPARLSSPTLV